MIEAKLEKPALPPTQTADPSILTQTQPELEIPVFEPKSVLVTGAHGMLGRDVTYVFEEKGHHVRDVGKDFLDITRIEDLQKLEAGEFGSPNWVINCAAYTAVDQAESEFWQAQSVNGTGPGLLADVCKTIGARLIHISTDFVFDGATSVPYTEEHFPRPLNKYGSTKLMGERNVKNYNPDAIIVRTSWLYGPFGSSFPRTMIKAWLDGKPLRVIDDQIGSPTYTCDLAAGLFDLVELDAAAGIYHLAGPEAISWHTFAGKALECYRTVHGLDREIAIEAISADEWKSAARRPPYSALDCSKAHRLGVNAFAPVDASLHAFCTRLGHPLEE